MTESNAGETGGIVEQLARDDVERKRFLKMAGKTIGTGAAATGLAAFIAACGSSSSSSTTASSASATSAASSTNSATTAAADPTGDLAIVNYALTLEYLEDQFYDKVIASGLFKGSVLSTLKTFGSEEHQHVLALESRRR